jgi:hypothetical protein
MRARAVGRLGQAQAEALGQEHERVQEPRGERNVVVEHQQPVMSSGRMLGQ